MARVASADEIMETTSTPASSAAPALEVAGLSKTFAGVRALRDARLTVAPGEVHGLVGENGSGKSTLIKLLAGFHAPDQAVPLRIGDTVTELPLKPGEAARLGLAFVHQDLGLIADVSVLENIMLDEIARAPRWRISWREQRRTARGVLAAFDLDYPLDATIAELRPADRALIAIARAAASVRTAVAEGAAGGVLVLDEPTVYLPGHERQRLFDLMRSVADAGLGLIFVSHDTDEVIDHTDRITVMRDGRPAGVVTTSETSADQLVSLILGRQLGARVADEAPPVDADRPVFAVRGLAGRGARDASLDVRRGAITGLTGLPGAGFDDIPYLLFGGANATAGTLEIDGEIHRLPAMSPARAVGLGMALIPADRQRTGAVGSLPVVDNLTLQILSRYRRGPVLSRRRMVRDAKRIAEDYDVRPRDPRLTYANLSGGNQQKVLLAKWVLTEPRLLLLHEPTQGVDVGAREEIFEHLRTVALEHDCAVLIASSDHEQLAAVCSEVAVVRNGRVAQTLRGRDVTQERITDACYSISDRGTTP